MLQSGSGLSRSWHQFQNAFRLAMDSIRAHKLRSFLTLLGVIIGVASVIMVGSAIEGLGVYAEESTAKAFGSESFLVAQIASKGFESYVKLPPDLRFTVAALPAWLLVHSES
jgi:putative ABC transport system permease protein